MSTEHYTDGVTTVTHSQATVPLETARQYLQAKTTLGYLQQAIAIAGRDPSVRDYLDIKIREVLSYAVMAGHTVDNWGNHDRD